MTQSQEEPQVVTDDIKVSCHKSRNNYVKAHSMTRKSPLLEEKKLQLNNPKPYDGTNDGCSI